MIKGKEKRIFRTILTVSQTIIDLSDEPDTIREPSGLHDTENITPLIHTINIEIFLE
jgi:hypothetical protein